MRLLPIAFIVLISTAAFAQQNATVTPSQAPIAPALQIIPDRTTTNQLDVEIGAVRLTNRSGRYTFAYLPLLAPLPGTAFRPSIEMPNALALTGTSVPLKPHTRARAQVGIR
jgi:hypothetical protein